MRGGSYTRENVNLTTPVKAVLGYKILTAVTRKF
jgi:hypothetical protein